jgi:hypothetical protein
MRCPTVGIHFRGRRYETVAKKKNDIGAVLSKLRTK